MAAFPQYVSSVQIAKILGVSRAMVGKYVKQGMPKHARGMYDVVHCVQWVIEGLKERRDDNKDNSELSLERLKLYQSQRIKTDLENARVRGELLLAEDVADAFNAMAAEVATRLDGVSGRLASELAGIDKPAEIQTLLLSEMRAIRQKIARGWDAIADSQDGIDDTHAAA